MHKKSFSISEEGLVMDGVLISSFFPQLREKRRIYNHDRTKTRKEFDIYVKFADGSESDTHTFSSVCNIKYSAYWDECCDAELSSEAKRGLQIFLQYIIKEQEYRECYEVEKLGLYVGEPIIFVYGYGKVIAPKGLNIIYSPAIPKYVFKEREKNTEELLYYAEKLMKLSPGVSDVLFCIRLLGVVRPLFSEAAYPIDFFVGLFGASGTLKSTYAKMFFASSDKQFLSFSNYNRKQVLKCLQQYSGHIVVIDDYHPLAKKYDREKQQSTLDVIARNADSGQDALAVITGEFMEGCFSLQDRMIQIKMLEDKVNGNVLSEKLQELQYKKGLMELLMYEFAKTVYSDFDNMKVIVQELFSRQENDIYTFRIERNIKFLIVAIQLFEKCFPDITKWGIEEQLERSLQKVLNTQKKHMKIVRRLEYDMDWTRELYLMLLSQDLKRKYEFPQTITETGEIIIKNDRIYITEMTLEREMRKFLECHVKSSDIAEHLSKTQVLEEDRSTARTKKMDGKRYYVINRSRLELYCKNAVYTDE